jgi:thiol-disulfide isomerase/thioredoxin
MLRKILIRGLLAMSIGVLTLAAGVALLYVTNTNPPLAAISAAEIEAPTRPYVIRMHAQWCHFCRGTKGAWEEVVEAYGDRANLLVLDFTNEDTWSASEAEARRLKLDGVLQDWYGASGIVLVVDGRTKELVGEVGGFADAAAYGAAIDAALARQ